MKIKLNKNGLVKLFGITITIFLTLFFSSCENTLMDAVEKDIINFYSPNSPSNLNIEITSSTSLKLTWQDNSDDENYFEIERISSINPVYMLLNSPGSNFNYWNDSNLSPGTDYTYRIRACNTHTDSDWSNEAFVSIGGSPAAPNNLILAAASDSSVGLSWTDNSSDEDSFRIERKLSADGIYSLCTILGQNEHNYTDTGLDENEIYYYRIRSGNFFGDSSWIETSVKTAGPPENIPADFEAVAYKSQVVKLTWTDTTSNETSFEIQRKKPTAVEWITILTPSSNTEVVSDSSPMEFTTYLYRIRAVNSYGESNWDTSDDIVTDGKIVISNAGNVNSIDMTCDSNGNIHVTFLDYISDDIYYTFWDRFENTISTELVESTNLLTMPSIAVDGNNLPHVSFCDRTDDEIEYKHKSNLDTWDNKESVISCYSTTMSDVIVNINTNVPYIFHFDNTSDTVRLMERVGSWSTDYSRTAGSSFASMVSVDLDSNGRPHLAFFEHNNDDLFYAFYNGSSWTETMLADFTSISYDSTSIIVDGTSPRIAYIADSNGAYYISYSSGWGTPAKLSSGSNGRYISLSLDDEGHPHVIYRDGQDASNRDLRLSYYNGTIWIKKTITLDSNNLSAISGYAYQNGRLFTVYISPDSNPILHHYIDQDMP